MCKDKRIDVHDDGRREKAKSACIALAVLIALLSCTLYWYSTCHSRVFLGSFAVLSVLVAGFTYLMLTMRKATRQDWPFRICLLASGLLFLGIFTPGSVPDEPYHFWSAYAFANVLSGEAIDASAGTLSARVCDVDAAAMNSQTVSWGSLNRTAANADLFSRDSSRTDQEVNKAALDFTTNPFYIRLFPALGILIARAMNLGAYPLFYIGRVFNFLFFCVLACLAIRITPVGKIGFKTICLLPMTLHLAASYSSDSAIMGLAFLLFALLLRLIYAESACERATLIGIPVCVVLLSPCKIIYALISLAVFFVPSSRFSSKRFAICYKCGVLLLGMMTIACLRAASLIAIAGFHPAAPILDYRGLESGSFYHLSDVFAHPIHTVEMFVHTLDQFGGFYISSAVGGSLGWFQGNIAAPESYVYGYLAILALSFVRCDRDDIIVAMKVRIVFFIICLVSWLAIMMSMYLGWTFNTEPIILGIQGRYFLPMLPLMGLCARSGKMRYAGNLATGALLAMVVLNGLYLMRIVSIVLVS